MPFGNQTQHDRTDTRDAARLGQVQIRKFEETLEEERKAHKLSLEQIEIRAQDRYETALHEITHDILTQRAALIQQTVHLKEQELSLNSRDDLINKTVHLLAVGQKQLVGPEADGQDLDKFLDVNKEIVHEQVTHEIRRRDRQVDAQLAIKREQLNQREATLDMREKAYSTMYKIRVADKLEADARARLEREIAARESVAYERGLAEGKDSTKADITEELKQTWYGKGYAACHNVTDVMKRFRAGLVAHDSPELTFLFDQNHPDNPFTRGLQIGRLDGAASSQGASATNGSAGLNGPLNSASINGSAGDAHVRSHPYAHLDGRTNGHVKGHDEPHGNGASNVAGTSAAFAKSHPYVSAYTKGHGNGHSSCTNGKMQQPDNYMDNHSKPGPGADPSYGVPMYGPWSATRRVQASLQNQTQTPRTPMTDGTGTADDTPKIVADNSAGQKEGDGGEVQINLIDLS